MLNKVILIGNVGKEPEVRAFPDTKVANLTLATTEKFNDKMLFQQSKNKALFKLSDTSDNLKRALFLVVFGIA